MAIIFEEEIILFVGCTRKGPAQRSNTIGICLPDPLLAENPPVKGIYKAYTDKKSVPPYPLLFSGGHVLGDQKNIVPAKTKLLCRDENIREKGFCAEPPRYPWGHSPLNMGTFT